jgi:hypothetical protein
MQGNPRRPRPRDDAQGRLSDTPTHHHHLYIQQTLPTYTRGSNRIPHPSDPTLRTGLLRGRAAPDQQHATPPPPIKISGDHVELVIVWTHSLLLTNHSQTVCHRFDSCRILLGSPCCHDWGGVSASQPIPVVSSLVSSVYVRPRSAAFNSMHRYRSRTLTVFCVLLSQLPKSGRSAIRPRLYLIFPAQLGATRKKTTMAWVRHITWALSKVAEWWQDCGWLFGCGGDPRQTRVALEQGCPRSAAALAQTRPPLARRQQNGSQPQ